MKTTSGERLHEQSVDMLIKCFEILFAICIDYNRNFIFVDLLLFCISLIAQVPNTAT